MTKLLLIRHGLSIANRDGIFIGQTDMDLTPEGFLQAERTAHFVKENYAVTHVYASDLSRAYHTGEKVAQAFSLPVTPDPRLREIYAGAWEGLTYPEMEERYLQDREAWRNDVGNSRCTEGESVMEMAARVQACLTEIAQRHEGETVVIATHATPIRAMVCLLGGGTKDTMKLTPWAQNASVTEIIWNNGAWQVGAIGQDAHLGELHSAELKKRRNAMNFKHSGLQKAVTFSYDDGVVQDIRLIELLNKYNLKCTFNLNSELLGQNRMLMRQGQRVAHYKVHPSDVREIYAGHEIAVHTLTHPNLTTLPEEEVIRQVEEDRRHLSELAGYEVIGMAYPCGGVNNDDRVAQILREKTGVQYSRTITCNADFAPQENLYRFNPTVYHLDFGDMMALGEKFLSLKTDTPQIFYVWGHSYEMDYDSENWARLEAFFRLISGKEDVFYGTNKDVLL